MSDRALWLLTMMAVSTAAFTIKLPSLQDGLEQIKGFPEAVRHRVAETRITQPQGSEYRFVRNVLRAAIGQLAKRTTTKTGLVLARLAHAVRNSDMKRAESAELAADVLIRSFPIVQIFLFTYPPGKRMIVELIDAALRECAGLAPDPRQLVRSLFRPPSTCAPPERLSPFVCPIVL